MRTGDFEGEVIFTAEEVAAILKQATRRKSVITIKIESNSKFLMALNFDMRTGNYHSVSSAQATHWIGMN